MPFSLFKTLLEIYIDFFDYFSKCPSIVRVGNISIIC